MDVELNSILKSICSKTDIELDVYSETKKFFISSRENAAPEYPVDTDFEGIKENESENKTYFKMRYKKADLVGVLRGCGKEVVNIAHLITEIVEAYGAKNRKPDKNEELRAILIGDYGKTQVQTFMSKYSIPDIPCFVLAFKVEDSENTSAYLQQYSNSDNCFVVMTDDKTFAFVKFDEKKEDYQSPAEYAEFIAQSVYEELGIQIKIGVGGRVSGLKEANISYQQAASVLRMSEMLSSKGSVHNYKEYLLVKMIEEIPKFKLREYMDILLDSEARSIFNDEDMINTAEEFLESNLNVSETSRKLFMHRNTLMYRLDKIEKITGLNIKKFSDAVSFRLMSIIYNILG